MAAGARAALDVLADQPGGQDRETEAAQRRGVQRIGIVGMQRAPDLDLVGRPAVAQPPDRTPVLELVGQAAVVAQIVGDRGHAGARQIARARADDPATGRKPDALQVVFPNYQVGPSALDTSIYAVFPYSRHLSPKVRVLVDFLVRRFSPRPSWELACDAAAAAE